MIQGAKHTFKFWLVGWLICIILGHSTHMSQTPKWFIEIHVLVSERHNIQNHYQPGKVTITNQTKFCLVPWWSASASSGSILNPGTHTDNVVFRLYVARLIKFSVFVACPNILKNNCWFSYLIVLSLQVSRAQTFEHKDGHGVFTEFTHLVTVILLKHLQPRI